MNKQTIRRMYSMMIIFLVQFVFLLANSEHLQLVKYENQSGISDMFSNIENDSLLIPYNLENQFLIPKNGTVTYSISTFSNVYGNEKKRYTFFYDNQKLMSKTIEKWNDGNWLFDERITNYFNQNKKLLTELKEKWSGNWEFSQRKNFIYDSNGFLTNQLNEEYLSTWLPTSKVTFVNDSNGYKILTLDESYVDSAWENTSKKEYKYDNFKNTIFYKSEIPEANQWFTEHISNSTYNSDNKIILKSYQTFSKEFGMIISNQTNYFYDSLSKLTHESTEKSYFDEFDKFTIYYKYNSNNKLILTDMIGQDSYYDAGKIYVDYSESTSYTYNPENILISKEIIGTRFDPLWISSNHTNKYYFTYDSINNLILLEANLKMVNWHNGQDSSEWEIAESAIRWYHTYDTNKYMLSTLSEIKQGSEWENYNTYLTFFDKINNIYYDFNGYYKFEIKYDEISNVNEVKNLQSEFNIFPNPTSGSINLSYRIETAGMVNIYLTDILGNQTLLKNEYEFPGDYVETFNLNVYPQGIYNIVLQSGDKIYSEKVSILR